MQIKTQIEKFIRINSDDKTQTQAMRLALLFTLIIWMILFVILAISPGWNQKKKYKTVQITLAPLEKTKPEEKIKPEQKIAEKAKTSDVQKQAEISKKSESVKQTQTEKKSQDSKPKTSETQKAPSNSTPKKTENSQSAQKKAETSAKPAASEPKKANIKYAKSIDELLEEQNSVSKSKNFDWDSMDFAENTNSSGTGKNNSAQNTQKLNSSAALSGTAGTRTDAGGAVSSENQKTSAGTNASSSTLAQLGELSKTEYSSVAAAGLDSVAKGINQHLNGKYSISMADGSPRILVFPAEPRLKISEENSKTIDSTRNLTITLKILADGTVPLGGVSFSPASAIDSSVRSELAAQIQTWRFSSAATDGQASFYYSIIKR